MSRQPGGNCFDVQALNSNPYGKILQFLRGRSKVYIIAQQEDAGCGYAGAFVAISKRMVANDITGINGRFFVQAGILCCAECFKSRRLFDGTQPGFIPDAMRPSKIFNNLKMQTQYLFNGQISDHVSGRLAS